ncbi:DinB family protein [Brevibacillus sp. HB1.3]|uniref:DinB family protein n=1 Tax=Brevibacillus sp. HB1.3 TaxID=2738842 RepID=UPI001552E0CB|nr:DinB family protein [Brevibacillus sp. HB1.3]NQF13896.1 DinB family protein [Brevibacillus sp. HB1.3]
MEKRHKVLFQQLADYRQETLKAIDGLTEEDVNIIPDGFSNNILWNLGHIYLDQYLWIAHLTKETIPIPSGFNEWFNFGTKPADWDTQPPKLAVLVSLLQEQPQKIQAAYKDRLEEEFPATESGMHTIAQVLVRTIFHEGMHLASLNSIRRCLGK